MRIQFVFILSFLLAFASSELRAQNPWDALSKRPSTLGLEKGYTDLDGADFDLKLVQSSQTAAALVPKGSEGVDFTPSDRIKQRDKDGLYHLGDLNLRLRVQGEAAWRNYSSATKRSSVHALPVKGSVLAAADLSPSYAADLPLLIKRYWQKENNHLVLRFELKNRSKQAIEIGSLGIPMIFNNILEGKNLDEAHISNVFYDPYIGQDAGYLQVTRLNGKGKVLLVVPYGKTPFEAYNPLLDDPTPRGIAFEGFYEWMVLSKAHAEQDWKDAKPWNNPTSVVLKPGESRSYGLQFILTDSVKEIESTLIKNKRPVAVGVPGYVLPQDVDGRLFIRYPEKVSSIEIEPKGALVLEQVQSAHKEWKTYAVNGKIWGRARLTITYKDGLKQTVNYKVIKPESQVVADFGRFLTHEQWFQDSNDVFKRSPSVISYDYEKKAQVKEESRAWIAGLSDEGGAGGWLAAIMKELVQPDKEEVQKLEQFVQHTLWGQIQYSEGEHKYGVKKSLFYYEPDKMPKGTYSTDVNYKVWSAWPLKEANNPGRSYNYPHVAAAHWVLYRLARNYQNMVTVQDWKWYLDNAYHTAMAMTEQAPYYAQFGQMEGTIFFLILQDLKAEGQTEMSSKLEAVMKKRADHWDTLKYPFGSEMPWDSTGQEEVYLWSDYFGYKDKAKATIEAILAYMPSIPHWGYNGSARRYWDFLYGGKLARVERQLHHYGSGLNAIPVLSEYRKNPDDLYLLRVGQGGLLGSISNITQDGFGSAAFHAFPSTLEIDGLSGDYGSNFFGYAVNTGTYITSNKEFGWLSFGGNLTKKGDWIHVKITTAAKSRVYIASLGLWLTLDAGKFDAVSFNAVDKSVQIVLEPGNEFTPYAYLHIDSSAEKHGLYQVKGGVMERGAYRITLNKDVVQISLLENRLAK